jgi:hypothetical protein
MTDTQIIYVTEVHNFGGFFGGDTVTLSATPWPEGEEITLTIDEKALDNVNDRYTIAPGMLLQLDMAGERVDQAHVLAAHEWEVLRAAIGDTPPPSPLDGPQVRAFHCNKCDLWIWGQPSSGKGCSICQRSLTDE